MKPLIKKVHQAFLDIVHAYVKNKEIGIELSDLSRETDEEFSLIAASTTAAALLERIIGIDAAETRKTFLIYLLKSAMLFEQTDDINLVLSSLESVHALFALSHSSMKTVDLMGEEFSLYGFNGWRVSNAAALVQEHIYQKVLGVTDDVSNLPWFILRALIESKSREFSEAVLLKDDHIHFLETKLDDAVQLRQCLQLDLSEKDMVIAAMEGKVGELVARIEHAQQRIQELTEELKRSKARPQLPLSPKPDASDREELRQQLINAQDQIEVQRQEILTLQRKLKEKTEPATVRVSSIMAGTGMFASGGVGLSEPPKQKKMPQAQGARK